jgi:hypothetical protein
MKSTVFDKEIEYIRNPRYKESVRIYLDLLPDYFYEIPASSTGKYHPSFALGDGGLVRHTKVAVKIANELVNSKVIGDVFTADEKDLIIFSLLLHDGLKEGVVKEKYTRFDHPLLIANFIKENKDKTTLKDEEVEMLSSIVAAHMGEYNTNPYSDVVLPLPKNKFEKMVHMCDLLASRKFLDVKFDENNNIIE